ncbi:MAG TPA: glycosyltransferase family 4 protein [Patescibacteria group bacterium]|nr:glycosyltransferase family 4 protein [Patescibacteria group bacterium]
MNKAAVLLHTIKTNLLNRGKIALVSEPADWVIKEIAQEIVAEVNAKQTGRAFVTYSPRWLRNKIIHFTSVNTYINKGRLVPVHPSNRILFTWYHVLPHDKRLAFIPELNKSVDRFHTPCTITFKQLVQAGADTSKLVLIPEGINLHLFKAFDAGKRDEIKSNLGLPKNKFIIGSFQKDGVGWGEGVEPKMEKGPDIFCAVVEELTKKFPIHVLLTGPARGYVKKRLTAANIPFTHHFLADFKEIVNYYNALDLYIVSSRQEGGPKAVLESMACGVPIISTRVGMAPDVIVDNENGALVEVEDVAGLVARAEKVLSDVNARQKLIAGGLSTVPRYNNSRIVQEYMEKLYRL